MVNRRHLVSNGLPICIMPNKSSQTVWQRIVFLEIYLHFEMRANIIFHVVDYLPRNILAAACVCFSMNALWVVSCDICDCEVVCPGHSVWSLYDYLLYTNCDYKQQYEIDRNLNILCFNVWYSFNKKYPFRFNKLREYIKNIFYSLNLFNLMPKMYVLLGSSISRYKYYTKRIYTKFIFHIYYVHDVALIATSSIL